MVKYYRKQQIKDIQKDIQKKLEERGIKLTEKQLIVLLAIAANPTITRSDLSNQCVVPVSSVTACISVFKKKKLITREGGRKFGKWLLKL